MYVTTRMQCSNFFADILAVHFLPFFSQHEGPGGWLTESMALSPSLFHLVDKENGWHWKKSKVRKSTGKRHLFLWLPSCSVTVSFNPLPETPATVRQPSPHSLLLGASVITLFLGPWGLRSNISHPLRELQLTLSVNPGNYTIPCFSKLCPHICESSFL